MTCNINVSQIVSSALGDKAVYLVKAVNYMYYFANLYTRCTSTTVLFACIFLGTLHASLAVHAAAPVKLAPALPGPRELVCVVAAAAAH